MQRPAGVTAIAIYYWLLAAYAGVFALLSFAFSNRFTLPMGSPLRMELEFYGPVRALVAAVTCGVIGWGLLRLQRWARWAGMLGMVPAIASLVVPISIAAIGFRLLWYGLLIALHAGAGFYLAQGPTALDAFEKK
jgi:hypothetical protein